MPAPTTTSNRSEHRLADTDENPAVLFVVRKDNTFPSSRFRFWQYEKPLRDLGMRVDFLQIEASKAIGPQIQFHKRLLSIGRGYTAVVYQKLMEPIRIRLLKLSCRRVLYDYDDAMYLESPTKFALTMWVADGVIAGNQTLAERALRYQKNVSIVPTTVIVPESVPPLDAHGPLRLSWIGMHSNLYYLEPVYEALTRLRQQGRQICLNVVTDKPDLVPKIDGVKAQQWSYPAEEEEFRSCHVGLMPLKENKWSRGKSACKALQYLSYGRPVLTSPVGVNRDIFESGDFGWLIADQSDWAEVIRMVDDNRSQLREMGANGRGFVQEHYSVRAWAPRYRDILCGLTG